MANPHVLQEYVTLDGTQYFMYSAKTGRHCIVQHGDFLLEYHPQDHRADATDDGFPYGYLSIARRPSDSTKEVYVSATGDGGLYYDTWANPASYTTTGDVQLVETVPQLYYNALAFLQRILDESNAYAVLSNTITQ